MNYFYKKFKSAQAFFAKLYVLLFFRNKKIPSHNSKACVADPEKPMTSASTVVASDPMVESLNLTETSSSLSTTVASDTAVAYLKPTLDEDILKAAEELEALKIDKVARILTVAEANAELVKAALNPSKLTLKEEIFFQALEKAINCPVLVNAKPAYLLTYPIALLYEAQQSGLLSDNIFFSQLALRYDTIPSAYFFKTEKEAIFSLHKPAKQRTLAHFIEIAQLVYQKINAEFFYDSSRFLRRCKGINIETTKQMDLELQQRLLALRNGRPSGNEVELTLQAKFSQLRQRLSPSQEGQPGSNELQDQAISLPEVPIGAPTAPVLVQAKSDQIVEAVIPVVQKSKSNYYGISEMTAAFLRGFIPMQKTRNDLLKPLIPDMGGNTCALQTIIENSSFVNRDFHHSEVKQKPAGNVLPESMIEKVSEVVNKTQFENRKLLREEAGIEKREACAAKLMKEVGGIIAENEKKKQVVKEDYQLLKDNCSSQEQLKVYFDSVVIEIDTLIQGCDQDDIQVYGKIKQELLDLRSAAYEDEANQLMLKIHSKPYWQEKESLQAMQDFLSVERQRLDSASYKKTTPKFRQEIDRNKYKEYCEIYTSTIQDLHKKGCFPSVESVPTIARQSEENANFSQTAPAAHFFQPKKMLSSVANVAGKVALLPFLILD